MPCPLNSALSSCSTKYLLNEWLKTEGGGDFMIIQKSKLSMSGFCHMDCEWRKERRKDDGVGWGGREKGESQGRI